MSDAIVIEKHFQRLNFIYKCTITALFTQVKIYLPSHAYFFFNLTMGKRIKKTHLFLLLK